MSDVTSAISEGPVEEAVIVAGPEQIASKPASRWRARVFQASLVAATAAFGILVVLASLFNYFSVDLSITRAVQRIDAAWFASLMGWVSVIGYAPQMVVLVAAVAVLLFFIGLRWEAVMALAAAAGGAGLGELIKIIVHRPRPGADLVIVLQQLNNFSFPSGHVLTFTAFFGFLYFLGYMLLNPSFMRTVLLAILGYLVGIIGVSRIYVGDHWASDALGAYLSGSLWLVLCVYVYRWGKTRFFVEQPLALEMSGSTEPNP